MSALWDKLDPGFFAPVWLLIGIVAMVAVLLLELGARRHTATGPWPFSPLRIW